MDLDRILYVFILCQSFQEIKMKMETNKQKNKVNNSITNHIGT